MASLRTLFHGVHASNGLIRALFLPTWYGVLLSPFALTIAWYFGLGQALQKRVPEDFTWFDVLPQIALLSVFLLLPTRLFSTSAIVANGKDGKRRVQSVPYWMPAFRSLGSLVFGGERWLKTVRESSISSITAYKAAGAKHNLVLTDGLLRQIHTHPESLEEHQESKLAILQNAFNMPNDAEDQISKLAPTISETIERNLFNDRPLEDLVKTSLQILSDALPDFVTFNSSIVDQMQWERVANIELTDGTSESECDLFMLINEFCCNAILPPVAGAQFTESYQLFATDLATFNSKFWALALGLPRLSPIQGLPAAALAQKRLSKNFTKLFDDLTDPPIRRVPADDESISGDEETDADVATPLTKLNELFTKHDLPYDVRAALGLQLIHNIVAEVVPLVFWTVLHIYSTSSAQDAKETPLQKIKDETKKWAQAIQPPSIHPSFPAPPEIRYASGSEATSAASFPYLRSCINEARRLYGCSGAIYKITKPITLQDIEFAATGEQDQWDLDIGSYIDIGLSRTLINSSPSRHPSPTTFNHVRFFRAEVPASIASPTDTSEPYKSALVISLVAGITQLWELAPAPKKSFLDQMQEASAEASKGAAALTGEQIAASTQAPKAHDKVGTWIIPTAVDAASIKVPKTDVRVRIRRREGLPASKVLGRIG
ncbi:hypothetical protein NX059_002207 [Plenodomus lindquistii]|nr:hypothetical protein NX059_002207 [Plenodomus lindquistii]